VRTLRMSTNILGNGFIEVIPDQALLDIQEDQKRHGMRGFAVVVKAAVRRREDGEFEFAERIGRFGWKCQEASLLNFAANAYLNNDAVGCAICNHPDFCTPKAGEKSSVLGKESEEDFGSDLETVPEALGSKIIHPFSDFLLHDIGTGDGIAQTQHAQIPPHGA